MKRRKQISLTANPGPHLFCASDVSLARVLYLERRVKELEAALAKAIGALRENGVSSITSEISQH